MRIRFDIRRCKCVIPDGFPDKAELKAWQDHINQVYRQKVRNGECEMKKENLSREEAVSGANEMEKANRIARELAKIKIKVQWQPCKEKPKNWQEITTKYRKIVNDVWQRIPAHARIALTAEYTSICPVYLFSDKSDNTFYGEVDFINEEEVILINVATPNPSWTIAHELAHIYVGTIFGWARHYWLMTSLNGLTEHLKKRSELIMKVMPGSHVEVDEFGDKGVECLVDLIAINWGFEKEYAKDIVNDHGLCEQYFRTKMLKIHRYLKKHGI